MQYERLIEKAVVAVATRRELKLKLKTEREKRKGEKCHVL